MLDNACEHLSELDSDIRSNHPDRGDIHRPGFCHRPKDAPQGPQAQSPTDPGADVDDATVDQTGPPPRPGQTGASLEEDVEQPALGQGPGGRLRVGPVALPVALVAALGRERAEAGLSSMDPIIAKRVASAFEVDAVRLAALERRRCGSKATALSRLEGFDAWISPTTAAPPAPLADLADPGIALGLALGMTRNTQPANYLDLAAVSLPLPMSGYALPAGLQLTARPGGEFALLAMAVAIENILGRPQRPDLGRFAAEPA